MNMTKNYTAQGGCVTVIGGELQIHGKLTIEPGAEVVGLADSSIIAEAISLEGIPPAEPQPDSTATTVAQLRDDFNGLLNKLRTVGVLASDPE